MAVLDLATFKRHLNIQPTDRDSDDLPATIAAAEAAVSLACGPLEPTATTRRVRGGQKFLSVPVFPVISVTTVTGKSGAVTAGSGFTVWSESGLLESLSSWSEDWYDVAYVAGRATCPPLLLEAAKEYGRYVWLSRRGGQGADSVSALRRAESLMEKYVLPGFA
jgi:hypothetical protein